MAVAGPRKVINRRVRYEAEHHESTKAGHPFFPYAMFHDTVVNLIVVLVIVAMAIIWHATAGPINHAHPTGQDGLAGRAVSDQGQPGRAGHRAAPGLVLPVPVRAAADLQDALAADLRHHHRPHHDDGAAGGVAVHRPRPRPPAQPPPGRRRSRVHRADGADRPDHGRRGGAGRGVRDQPSPATRRSTSWQRRRSSSRRSAPPATTSAAAAGTSARTSRTGPRGRRWPTSPPRSPTAATACRPSRAF